MKTRLSQNYCLLHVHEIMFGEAILNQECGATKFFNVSDTFNAMDF